MEQRNGRLDRHGQERDVHVFHFDSTDDASMRFLGKVLAKRSQTREDRVVTDEIFADAILAHFEEVEDAGRARNGSSGSSASRVRRTPTPLMTSRTGIPLPGRRTSRGWIA
jgi:hypothetical protein